MPYKNYFYRFPPHFLRKVKDNPGFKERIRHYKTPNDFMRWEDLLTHFICVETIMNNVFLAQGDTLNKVDNNTNLSMWHNHFALTENAHLRFLSRHICESFLRTKISNLSFEPKEPLPFMILCLPKGVLIDDEDHHCCYAIVSPISRLSLALDKRMRQMEDVFELTGITKLARGAESFSAIQALYGPVTGSIMRKTNPLTAWSVPAFDYEGIAITYSNGRAAYSFTHAWNTLEEQGSIECDPDAASFMNNLCKICLNAYFTMGYKPELVSEDACYPSQKTTSKSSNFRRSNVWIGKDYVPRSSHNKFDSQDPTGKISPHWRSGHWHTVLSGQGRKERELRWFDPVYVNPQ